MKTKTIYEKKDYINTKNNTNKTIAEYIESNKLTADNRTELQKTFEMLISDVDSAQYYIKELNQRLVFWNKTVKKLKKILKKVK